MVSPYKIPHIHSSSCLLLSISPIINKVREIQESESVEKGLPRFVQPRNSPHSYMARLYYPTTAMATAIPRTSYQQQHTAADQEQREEETNQRTENGAGVTFTGHEVRQWRQTSRESATEEIRDSLTQRVRSGKGSPPKDRRRRDGGAQGVASLGKRRLQLQ